jgi:hypothetical protein
VTFVNIPSQSCHCTEYHFIHEQSLFLSTSDCPGQPCRFPYEFQDLEAPCPHIASMIAITSTALPFAS